MPSALPIAFATKAETLERVTPVLTTARVLPLIHFTVREWREGRDFVLARLAREPWAAETLIVRSSAIGEDSSTSSQAGCFQSVGHVLGEKALADAIDTVIASYGTAAGETSGHHRVLVQPMLRDAAMSGVAFSLDPNTGAPYVVINYEEGGDTAAVTGGHAGALKTFYYWKPGEAPCPPPLAAVIALIRELEALFGIDNLDVEFAFDAAGTLHLFQIRPLVLRQPPVADTERHRRMLGAIAAKITAANRPHPYLHGDHTVYGVMPDWNPAEIIGVRPRPLALSLYRELVTDSTWAYQRHNYGYRNLRSFPLMVDFNGLPYIDVRVSFNSFIPGDVDAGLAARLVSHYIDRLIAMPALHDKVEFDIVLSCYTFDLPQRMSRLAEHGFSEADRGHLADRLRQLTNRIINRDGLWRGDLQRIAELERRQPILMDADVDPVARIYWLLEDCKRYGTLPFAGLARAGFIAIQMLNSLVTIGVLSEAERAAFLAGVDTVGSRIGRDLRQLDRSTFLAKYGHLRPGAYDILSPRYDEAPDRYFDWAALAARPDGAAEAEHPRFALSLDQMRQIAELLERHGLEHDVVGLFDFLEGGIRGREFSKFVFTRSLSDALALLGRLGAAHGLSIDDMSYVDIGCIYRLHVGSHADAGALLRASVEEGRERHALAQQIVLPPLIVSPDQVWAFHMPPNEPNFITQKRVLGSVRAVSEGDDLAGAIVMIPNADPGFDWIFSRGIAGFITAYGGVNSHMAIRAGELGLPAVIGAGEVQFARWSAGRLLEIDCGNRQVRIMA